ncbi:MAG TPA: M15 family metallopeptidase [Polyangiaceae bacterium]|jgi:hypothetical protein|nr:M15 family metallopeptidase [Polyangiaceae bacterium]
MADDPANGDAEPASSDEPKPHDAAEQTEASRVSPPEVPEQSDVARISLPELPEQSEVARVSSPELPQESALERESPQRYERVEAYRARRAVEHVSRRASPGARAALLGLAFVAPCVVIALGIYFIVKGGTHAETTKAPSASASAIESAPEDASAAPAESSSAAAAEIPLEKATPVEPGFADETDDGEPAAPKKAPPKPKHYSSVQQAASESCSTASVDGLSRQIIEQARCIKPNAFVPLPPRPNLVLADHVYPYLEADARNHLLKALDARTSSKMTINSVLRTVAQQYLVWRWAAGKRCGVQLATAPGESNHEIGIALDVAEAGTWRPALEAQDFKWLGTSDRVHFDYKGGSDTPSHTATDVLAFQTLWNRNHPTDKIAATGHYNPETEARLKKAPPEGFALGPTCKASGGKR